MKRYLLFILLIAPMAVFSQAEGKGLESSMRRFHQALVDKNTGTVGRLTHPGLSYGHSNGWIETRVEMIRNLETGYISYARFREDNVSIQIHGKQAIVRFIGDINATLHGKAADYHLKVLEVWVRKGKRWLLFARQALK